MDEIKAERDALKLRVADLEAFVVFVREEGPSIESSQHGRDVSAQAQSALSGDTTALRALLVEAMRWGGCNAMDGSLTTREVEAHADAMLGRGK